MSYKSKKGVRALINIKKLAVIWGAVGCMLISGCSVDKLSKEELQTPEEIMATYEGKLYTVNIADGQVLITEDGRELLKGMAIEIFEDPEGAYKYVAIMDNADGTVGSRLLDGKLEEVLPRAPLRYISLWEGGAYVTRFEEDLITENDFPGERFMTEDYDVIRLSDGKSVVEGNLSKISSEEGLFISTVLENKYISIADSDYQTVGWLDMEGNAAEKLPAESIVPLSDLSWNPTESEKDSEAKGFYAGWSRGEDEVYEYLYDKDFNRLLNGEGYNRITYFSGYVAASKDGGTSTVYSLPDLKEVYSIKDSSKDGIITYYDGEVMIKELQYKDEEGTTFRSQMATPEGEPLGEVYESISHNYSEDEYSDGLFTARVSGEIYLLNNKGEVVMEVGEGDYTGVTIGKSMGVYTVDEKGDSTCRIVNIETQEVIIPDGQYAMIYPLYGKEKPSTMWYGSESYSPTTLGMLMDAEGNIIINGIKDVQLVDEEKGYIQARRGFYEGMMDLEGRWIYKSSVFGNMDEDYLDYAMYY